MKTLFMINDPPYGTERVYSNLAPLFESHRRLSRLCWLVVRQATMHYSFSQTAGRNILIWVKNP